MSGGVIRVGDRGKYLGVVRAPLCCCVWGCIGLELLCFAFTVAFTLYAGVVPRRDSGGGVLLK